MFSLEDKNCYIIKEYYSIPNNNLETEEELWFKYMEYKSCRPFEGRMYADEDSLQRMGRVKRNLCLERMDYIEIDIVNCFPTILVEICKKYDIQCPNWIKYNENRDEILQGIINIFSDISPILNKNIMETTINPENYRLFAKRIFFNAMYGNTLEECRYACLQFLLGVDEKPNEPIKRGLSVFIENLSDDQVTFYNDLYNESIEIMNKLWNIPEYQCCKGFFVNDDEHLYNSVQLKTEKSYFLYAVFTIYERKYLEDIIKNFKIEDEIICLLFDGLIIKTTKEEFEKKNECQNIFKYAEELYKDKSEKVKINIHKRIQCFICDKKITGKETYKNTEEKTKICQKCFQTIDDIQEF